MLALFLLLALLLVLVGHAFRLLRWEQFIRIYERPPRGQMLRGMAGGYALNFVLPFHLGDAFRAVYTGRRMKSGIGFALATVIMDRFLDVWFVAFGFIAFRLLGLLCGQVWIPLLSAIGEFLLGYFAAYGGKRSDLGSYAAAQVLGFRRYAKKLPTEDVSRLMANDPDYFFNLAPFTLALGVIKPFARAFGHRKLERCPYLVTRARNVQTAEEWAGILLDTADRMDEKLRQMQIDRWIPVRLRRRRK